MQNSSERTYPIIAMLALGLMTALPSRVLAEDIVFQGWTHQKFGVFGGNNWRAYNLYLLYGSTTNGDNLKKMGLNLNLPSGGGALGPIYQGRPIAITTPELVAGYTSTQLEGIVCFMQINVIDNNITWTLNPKVFRFFWDTTISNFVNMNVPNTYSQSFKQFFTPDGITGGTPGAVYTNSYSSFFTIQANPALVGVAVEINYCYWDI